MRDDDLKIIDEFLIKVKLDYKGLKLMFPQYGKEEEDNE